MNIFMMLFKAPATKISLSMPQFIQPNSVALASDVHYPTPKSRTSVLYYYMNVSTYLVCCI